MGLTGSRSRAASRLQHQASTYRSTQYRTMSGRQGGKAKPLKVRHRALS